jgi:hypothetical protein
MKAPLLVAGHFQIAWSFLAVHFRGHRWRAIIAGGRALRDRRHENL